MKKDMKTAIRETLRKIIRQREWLIDNGYGEKTAARCAAISTLRNALSLHQNSDSDSHLRMIIRHKGDIAQVMPGIGSRHRNMRESMLTLIDYAERKEAAHV